MSVTGGMRSIFCRWPRCNRPRNDFSGAVVVRTIKRNKNEYKKINSYVRLARRFRFCIIKQTYFLSTNREHRKKRESTHKPKTGICFEDYFFLFLGVVTRNAPLNSFRVQFQRRKRQKMHLVEPQAAVFLRVIFVNVYTP